MLRSLVGSEMCIRDRLETARANRVQSQKVSQDAQRTLAQYEANRQARDAKAEQRKQVARQLEDYELLADLLGRDGLQRTVFDGARQAIEVQDVRRTRAGRRLKLTLDAEVQARTEEVLKGVGETYQPKTATAIVMDPRTGALLAVANWPRVDANAPGKSPAWALKNQAVGLTYEPGSTFKAFTVAAALEDGEVTPTTSFNLAPQIQVADRTIGESHPRGWVTLDTSGILAQSSNVGAITIGQKLGGKRWDTSSLLARLEK